MGKRIAIFALMILKLRIFKWSKRVTLNQVISCVREKWGNFKGELYRAQFFRNSRITRPMFIAKLNIIMRIEHQ